ncbi:MAG: restriction endonuclease subunit S [Saccharospirillum sp.]|nr:restriction endonuclease subunit S [Saccharospirillum sp.]
MSFKGYLQYKNSGVDWIGNVPEHWDISRLKIIFIIQKRIAGKLGLEVLSITNKGIKVKDIESGDGQLSNDYSKYQLVLKGDFAMNHMDLLTGYVDISAFDGVTSPDYRVFSVRQPGRDDPRYLLRLLQNAYHQKLFFPFGQGSAHLGRWRLPAEEFKDIFFPRPPFSEQQIIARFLDHETAKIDALIREQERLIALLQEKRQAVISHAVTKGLDPNVPMKDSGVEWLGEVPAHWVVGKFKWYLETTSGGTPPSNNQSKYYDGNIPWLRTLDLNNGEVVDYEVAVTEKAISDTSCRTVPKDSVLIAMYGGDGTIGKNGLLQFDAAINQAICAFLPNPNICPKFLHFFIQFYRPYWMIGAESSRKDPNIGQDRIGDHTFVIPPIRDQRDIATQLSEHSSKFDDLIAESNAVVNILAERRSALISAAVTGKIDVRNWQPPADESAFPEEVRQAGLEAEAEA